MEPPSMQRLLLAGEPTSMRPTWNRRASACLTELRVVLRFGFVKRRPGFGPPRSSLPRTRPEVMGYPFCRRLRGPDPVADRDAAAVVGADVKASERAFGIVERLHALAMADLVLRDRARPVGDLRPRRRFARADERRKLAMDQRGELGVG